MRSNSVLGLVFCNTTDQYLPELTVMRTMASIPFGCRYRLVDFALSSMVNAGIEKIGLITKRSYHSLSDHVRSGRSWDLARKNGGLSILSPYLFANTGLYKGKIDALGGCLQYIESSKEEFVLLCPSNLVQNIDLNKLLEQHFDSDADITIAHKPGIKGTSYVRFKDGKIERFMSVDSIVGDSCYLDTFVIRRQLLINLIKEAVVHNYIDLTEDILNRQLGKLRFDSYEVKEYTRVIDSMQSYFDVNMDLLDGEVRGQLFNMKSPVYTKLRDDMPTRYGFDSKVSDSLIADGCVIEGEVRNSIIFRGVKIAKGAKVENCIIMQSANIGENSSLSYVVSDKNVAFKEGRTLMGCRSFPLVIGKNITV